MATQRDGFRAYNYEDGGMSLDNLLTQIEQPQKTPTTNKSTVIDNLVSQIKARSNTSQWTGGFGADEATKDMARILADTGITDISQFGPITQQVERVVGYEEWGAPIYQTVTEQTFGNKETGQAVANTYTERQKGDFFGGTYEGKGNTGYGVQFDAQGQPIFYTQGASSADPIAKAVVPIASLALAAYGAPNILGNALLGTGANQVAAGALGGALIGGGTAALTDQNIGRGALLGGAGGALTGYLRGDLAGVTSAEINAASDAASSMADSGLSIAEINNQLEIAGFKPAAIASALEDASNIISAPPQITSLLDQAISPTAASAAVNPNAVVITAPSAPSTIGNVISTIAQQPVAQQTVAPSNEVVITTPSQEQIAISAGFPDLNSYNLFNGNLGAYNQARTLATNATRMAVRRQDVDLSYDVNNDGKVTSSDALMIAKGTPLRQLETVQVTAPVTTPTIGNVISTIAQQPTPVAQPVVTSVVEPSPTSVEITTQKPTQQIDPNVLNAVNTALQTNVTKPIETVQITGQSERPKETPTIANVISAISTPSASTTPTSELVITGQTEKPTVKQTETQPTIPLIMSPTAPTSVQTEPVKPQPEKEKEKSWTAAQLADLARLGLLATTVFGATDNGPQRFPIVPIPANWKSPTYGTGSTNVAPTQLPPIDFGNRELLRGTQWEKFLDPNYGQVPAPVQFSQPSNLSYQDLMGILGSKSGMPASSNLSINDVISGIQNQYGQTANSAVGQKPA